MIIRSATRFDIPRLTEMMQEYRKYSPIESLKTCNNVENFHAILAQILAGRGQIFVAEKNNFVVGMLIAIINPNIWEPSLLAINELAYWVDVEYRNTSAGYRLLQSYKQYCEEKRSKGEINYYTISKMVNSPDLDYQRFGFQKTEEMWRI